MSREILAVKCQGRSEGLEDFLSLLIVKGSKVFSSQEG